MLWISMELEMIPVIHLELLQLEGNMSYPYEYSFKMGDMMELFEVGLFEYSMLCYRVALNVPVYEHVFDVEDLVSHTLMGDAILCAYYSASRVGFRRLPLMQATLQTVG